MKLVSLYSNQPSLFASIDFNDGLSAIVAEIRRPNDQESNTHNLGKTTVGPLIDFCLLKRKDKSFFLFKNEELFESFVFYLEVQLSSTSFVTIRRPVAPGTRVSILRSASTVKRADLLEQEKWDHCDVPFDRAKFLLDGIFGFTSLSPWDYRMLVGYLIRDQSDYRDVFKLTKFAGKHAHWKPFVAHLMGLPSEPVRELYKKRTELEASNAKIALYGNEWDIDDTDASDIDGLLALKRDEVEAAQEVFETLDFSVADDRARDGLVDEVEANISALNERAYELRTLTAKIEESIGGSKINFRTQDAKDLFEEAGILLGDQLVKNYDQLIQFNCAITRERKAALKRQLENALEERDSVLEKLHALQVQRSELLEYLRASGSMEKLKDVSRSMSTLQGEVVLLESKQAAMTRLSEMSREQVETAREFEDLQHDVEIELRDARRDSGSRFADLRRYFSEFIQQVLGQKAVLGVRLNDNGGIEFSADFVNEGDVSTSESSGTSYRKLLCMGFDFAVLRAHLDVPFPRFVFHDGAFEQLDRRMKENLLLELRKYAGYGLQPIITTLDSDIPLADDLSSARIIPDEVVLSLHDDGEQGRLFRMPKW